MKKDKKWLRDELMKFKESTSGRYEDVIGVSHVLRAIDQLDEPEVLSQEWIDNNVVHIRGLGDIFEAETVENLLVPKQELPVIPQFVADEFDYNKNPYWEVDEAKIVAHILRCAFGGEAKPSEFLDWVRENPEDYVMAVKNGCEIKKEKLYYIQLLEGKSYLCEEPFGELWFNNSGLLLESSYKGKMRFTEKEIKSINEHYWQFAVEVAE